MMNVDREKFDHDIVFEFCKEFEGKRESGTLNGYRWSARNFIEFLETKPVVLEDVSWEQVDEFISEMSTTYPDSTLKTRYNHLRTFFKYLRDYHGYYEDRVLPVDDNKFSITDYIDRGQTEKSEESAARGGIIFLRPSEFDEMVKNVPSPKFRNELLLKILYGMGLRRKEASEIQIEPSQPHRNVYGDINMSENRLQVRSVKSTESRSIWFDNSIKIPLQRWIETERNAVFHAEESKYLFPTRKSEKLSPKRITEIVKQTAENAGIQSVLYYDANGDPRRRITTHAFRHGFAVQHVRNGTNIKVLKDLLGHKDLTTTQIYLQFDDRTKRQAQFRNAPKV